MATVICPACGTRNADTMDVCRRCGSGLPDREPVDTRPMRPSALNPPAAPVVLGGQWRIEGPMPESDTPHSYIGRNVTSGRTVIIKRPSSQAVMDRSVRARFAQEASILRDLSHPNLVRVLDFTDDGDAPALVMAFPSGDPLGKMLSRLQRLPLTVVTTLALQLLDALDYLHGKGVMHRNLRTSNIYVGPDPRTGLPLLTVTDFGAAGSVFGGEPVQTSGTLLGMKMTGAMMSTTPSPYTSPELVTGAGEPDERADIYSLGAILFEMLTGTPPLGSGITDPDQLLNAIQTEAPTMLRLLRPEAPAHLEDVIFKMLEKVPQERFVDIAQARLALLSAEVEPMVPVPRGPFLRGSLDDDPHGRPEERPMHETELDAFFADRFPVTVAQFRRFLDTTGRKPEPSWERHNPPERSAHPVVYVTWEEAAAYAEWAGKRLLTEAEWEKAARGTDARTFPWGDDPPTPIHANFGKTEGTDPVTAHPRGASPYGAMDMAGNAFEWVQDWYDKDAYSSGVTDNPRGPDSGKKKVLRGGSFVHDAFALRCATRARYAPEERRANHGFRCAWSLD